MSKRISFADIAVNAALVLLSAAAAVLLCIYLFGGRAADNDTSDTDSPHIINASEPEASQTFVTSVTETTVISEELETFSETEPEPQTDIGEYSPAFFQNMLFIGDSLSVGLINYEFLPSENVFAKAGITTSSVVNTNIDDVSVFTKATRLNPEYICIMLGTNSVAYVEGQQMAEELGEFIDMIAGTCPNAKIVLASVPPVTQKHEEEKPEHLEAIVAYNELVEKLAEEKSIAFADTFALLKDETGYLSSRYAEHDGLHLKIHAYPVILGAVQKALIEYYGIDFVPPPETEANSDSDVSAVSAAVTVSVGTEVHETEAPTEADDDMIPESDVSYEDDELSDLDSMEDTDELDESDIT
ncbi:MAG: hypothetical protein K2J73_03820 [Oscillospiraceae bacterium]|nr:hypothetical protein [Oscillospiraceae bacterium]